MIRLVPMTGGELEAYLEIAIPEYAADRVRAGHWSEDEALERSRKSYHEALPRGVKTEHNYLFQIQLEDSGEGIGMVWMKHQAPRPHGFIYEILLDEAHRGKGYGKQAMLALEEFAKDMGLERISLHVFTHNTAAVRLYEGLGYEVTNQNMVKKLDQFTDSLSSKSIRAKPENSSYRLPESLIFIVSLSFLHRVFT